MIRRTLFYTSLIAFVVLACADPTHFHGDFVKAGGLFATALLMAYTYREEDYR
jgi:hypothetical protein